MHSAEFVDEKDAAVHAHALLLEENGSLGIPLDKHRDEEPKRQ